jgi:hypothetical protein
MQNNSSVHDEITSLIKDIKPEISLLTLLINKSFSSGIVPFLLRMANVISILKQTMDKE